VSGPLVVANRMSGSFMHELVRVGPKRIVVRCAAASFPFALRTHTQQPFSPPTLQTQGEIIKLEGDNASIQCYEDTSGLTTGDAIERTLAPLSVELGPGIMENIFDGIQRPLEVIFDGAGQSPFVPLGVDVAALSTTRKFAYRAAAGVREGQILTGGSIIGEVYENELMRSHKIMVPPDVYGEVVAIYHGAAKGGHAGDGAEDLAIHEPLLRIRQDDSGELVDVSMSHKWPVRKPRPVAEKLTGKEALITGALLSHDKGAR